MFILSLIHICGYNLPEMTITAVPCENPVYPDADSFEVFNTIGKPYDQYYEPVIEITDEETDAPGFLCRGGSFKMCIRDRSTVHKDVTERLEHINPALAARARVILNINKSERHIRGGMATKEKYQHRLAICSREEDPMN